MIIGIANKYIPLLSLKSLLSILKYSLRGPLCLTEAFLELVTRIILGTSLSISIFNNGYDQRMGI